MKSFGSARHGPAPGRIGKQEGEVAETFFEKWRGRLRGAWWVLTGQAYAAFYVTEREYWESTGPMFVEMSEVNDPTTFNPKT